MELREHVALAPLTTFGVGGAARWLVEARSEDDVLEAVRWAGERRVPLFVLGGGSNLLVPDAGFPGLVLRVGLLGVIQEGCAFDVAAGENWDEFVQATVEAGCAGVECLAGIPGTVGGTPVQNVGAYGQEVSETIESVRALDRTTGQFVELGHAACGFRYRESVLNTTERGRYIVTRVRFRLRHGGEPTLKYVDLRKHFGLGSGPHVVSPSLTEVAEAVREIRAKKGMVIRAGDPDARSAGSFFKNPVVGEETVVRVARAAAVPEADVPRWPAGTARVKLPAAWLLEKAGFVKGFGDGRVGISSKHTLALVNRGGATFADVAAFQDEIVGCVAEKFGVVLEREPVLLGAG